MNKNKTFTEVIEDILEKHELSLLPSEGIKDDFHPVCLEEISTISCDDIEGGMCIIVSRSEFRKGNPYFKVVNHNSFEKATKIARISFLDLKYIIHKGYVPIKR